MSGTWGDHGRGALWLAGVTDTPADLVFALDRAVLTADEMAAGPRSWRTYDDPFDAVWSSRGDQDVQEAS